MADNMTPTPDGQNEQEDAQVRDVKLLGRGRFGKWLENFWYHYKFRTIAVLLLAVALVICIAQCAGRPKRATFNICYAGDMNLGTSMSGDTPTQVAMKKSLYPAVSRITEEDDEKKISESLSFYNYLIDDDSSYTSVLDQSRQNKQNLKSELDAASGYLFLLSESLFEDYAFSPAEREPYMVKVDDYLPADASDIRLTEDHYGVYLHSTPLGEVKGFCDLPEDTILCLRISFSVFQHDSRSQRELYAQNEALFRAMLNGDL